MLELNDEALAAMQQLERLARRAEALHRAHRSLRRREAAGEDVAIELAKLFAHHRQLRLHFERAEAVVLPLALQLRAENDR